MELQELKEKLRCSGIDVSLFGKGQAKTLEALLNEINNPREGVKLVTTVIGNVYRMVEVFNIHVFYHHGDKRLRLREALQIFNDGRFRARLERLAAISEKMHSNESYWDGVARALREELGIEGINLENTREVECRRIEKISQSFPGLVSTYEIHYVNYFMEEKFFCPEGYVEVQKDKKTYFVWEEIEM
jgi:hypothetical protein